MRLLGDLTEVADRMLCWRGACRQFEWGEGSLVRSLRWAWRGSCCHNTTRTRRNERSQSHQRPVTNRSQRPCSLSLHHRLTSMQLSRVVDPRWRASPPAAARRASLCDEELGACEGALLALRLRVVLAAGIRPGSPAGVRARASSGYFSARRSPRERGRTCAVGPSDSFSDNQNWPVRISSLT
jgi:hypothetical protein